MNVSAWCIRNPIAAIMFFVMLCFAGTVELSKHEGAKLS